MINDYKRVFINGRKFLEHRIIMEKHLKRKLLSTEIIHHIDGNSANNDINNLKITTLSHHTSLHKKTGKTYIDCICINCKKQYKIGIGKYHHKLKNKEKFFCCSRCIGLYMGAEKNVKNYHNIVLDKYNKGLTGYKIAQKYNLNRTTVYNIIKQHNKLL